MVMLSELSRFEIVDKKSDSAKIADLSVALLDSDYPPVTNLFFQSGIKFMKLSWKAVESVDWKKKRFFVSDLGEAEEVSAERKNEYVLLKREILDALLLDLENRRSIRANDLRLLETEGVLQLQSADNSIGAILRRISFGLYRYVSREGHYDWKYVEFLRGNPEAALSGAGYHLRITRMPPGEIAQLINYLPYLHAAELITLLPDEKAVKTLEVVPIERRLQIFEELEKEQAVRLLTLMAPDAAADLAGMLQTDVLKQFLEVMPKKQSSRIIELLRYPEETVGAIMTNDIVFLPENMTVAESRACLRERFSNTDFIYLIYIVSDNEKRILRGVISLRSLFNEDDDCRLKDIMDPYISTLNSIDDVTAASYRVVDSQLAAMPVVGADRELIGAVTIDAAIMQIAPSTSAEALRIFS
jgi:CBS domain-containing protein